MPRCIHAARRRREQEERERKAQARAEFRDRFGNFRFAGPVGCTFDKRLPDGTLVPAPAWSVTPPIVGSDEC